MRIYVVSSILIILALAALFWKGTLPVSPPDWKAPYLSELSSALLISGLLSVLYRVFVDSESANNLKRLLRIHDSVDDLGLEEILAGSNRPNYFELITESDSLSIVLNDGLRWVGNHAIPLQDRMGKRGNTTEVFLIDPESSAIACLASKTSLSEEELRKKISDSWARLDQLWANSEKRSAITIYKLKHFPTRSLFLSEDRLIEAPYQIASGRTDPPSYMYRRVPRSDSPYAFAARDIEMLKKESTIAKSYTPQENV